LQGCDALESKESIEKILSPQFHSCELPKVTVIGTGLKRGETVLSALGGKYTYD
jgi:hypothetical protein